MLGFRRKGKIENWYEGIPLGNGRIGALFYGSDKLICSLDKAGLWDLTPPPEISEDGFTYANMKKLAQSGKESDWREFMRLFNDCYKHPLPTKINAGMLIFSFPVSEETIFHLNAKTAVAEIADNEKKAKAFISAAGKIGAIYFNCKISCRVEVPQYYYDEKILALNVMSTCERNNIRYFYHIRKEGGAFGIALQQNEFNNGTEFRFFVFDEKDEKAVFNSVEKIFTETDGSFGNLLRKHRAWWKTFWEKSFIAIPDKSIQKYYDLSNYLFGSGSREGEPPMPLQGLWTKCDGTLPPWKGDYHHDLNTQFTYCAYLSANHLSEGKAFIDYLWKYKEEFEKFAREFFGVKGLLVPGVSSLDGKPLGGWPMYALSPTMSIWLAKSFSDYYEYTEDEIFFEERVYPFFSEVAEAISGLLYKENEKFYLPLSSSPEYGDCTPKAFLKMSNNDLQLLHYLYATMSRYAKKKGESYEEYDDILSCLDTFYMDKDNIFLLDGFNRIEESHRHHSNLMCIYPLMTLQCGNGKNSEIIERNLVRLEKLGTGQWVGFSFAWFSALASMNYSANRALFALQTFCRCFLAENGFHLNGDFKKYGVSCSHYHPFTLEANFVFCDAVHKMLLQDHEGFLHIFPCLPAEWKSKTISFKLRACGNLLIEAHYRNGFIEKFTVFSEKEKTVKIKNTFGKEKLEFSGKQKIHCKKDEIFILHLLKGETFLKYERQ